MIKDVPIVSTSYFLPEDDPVFAKSPLKKPDGHYKNGFVFPRKHGKENALTKAYKNTSEITRFRNDIISTISVENSYVKSGIGAIHAVESPQTTAAKTTQFLRRNSSGIYNPSSEQDLTRDPGEVTSELTTEVKELLGEQGTVDENANFEKMTAAPEQEVTPADEVKTTGKEKGHTSQVEQMEEGHAMVSLASTTSSDVVRAPEEVKPRVTLGDAVLQNTAQESKISTDTRGVMDGESLVEYISRASATAIPPESLDVDHIISEPDALLGTPEDIALRCAHCALTFNKVTQLQDHMWQIHPDRPIQFCCSRCDEVFTNRSQLDKHLALHSPNCQTCKMCQKTFANVYRLQRHMISHDESSELRKFKCPECSKAFKFKHHLKEHIRIHSGEKPFECNNCSKRFSHSGSYSSHMTSKKCWNINGKTRERNANADNLTSSPYHTPPRPVIDLTQAASVYPAHLLRLDPRNTPGIPAYFSPTSISHATFIPYPLYSGKPQQVSTSPKHGILAATALYNSKVVQLKPTTDVNSNTLETLPQNEPALKMEPWEKEDDERGEVSGVGDCAKDAAKEQAISNVCRFCDEQFENPVTFHQHMKYDCTKNITDDKLISLGKNASKTCKFCHASFSSPVELHQHERYLCKKNLDIVPKPLNKESCHSPPGCTVEFESSKKDASMNGDLHDSDEDNEESKDDSEKKLRMRSLINDEQQRILRAYYEQNPRPRKYELIQIGNRVGFSKRVVQVWFQNMRARDRKRGRTVPYFPSMARYKRPEIPCNVTPAKYIPVVPQPFNGYTNQIRSLYAAETASSTPLNLSMTATKTSQDAPLDLSVKRHPPQAHCGSVISASLAQGSAAEALNLSKKDDRPKEPNKPSAPAVDTSFRDSAIFKYMQREGIFIRNTLYPIKTSTPKFAHSPNSAFQQCHDGYMKSRKAEKNTSGDSDFAEHPGNLVIDESRTDGSTMDDSDEDEDGQADSGHYSIASYNGAEDDQMKDDVAAGREKRMRKKTWRQQVECDQTSDDVGKYSPRSADGSPMLSKKRRKSWKNHRIDSNEGMYACDQCDKLFSKQSSLARHKYEHSGTRPFSCAVCYKAFKHKHHLTEHNRLHSGEKPFVCKKCGKRFSHSGSFSQHMNHRYKYCKPSMHGEEDGGVGEEFGCESPPLDEATDEARKMGGMPHKRSRSESEDDEDEREMGRDGHGDIYELMSRTNERKKARRTGGDDGSGHGSDDNAAEIRRRLDAIYSLTNLKYGGGTCKAPRRDDGTAGAVSKTTVDSSSHDVYSFAGEPDARGRHSENAGADDDGEISTSQKIINAIRNFSNKRRNSGARRSSNEAGRKFPLDSVENSDDSSDSCAESTKDDEKLDMHLQCLNLVRK